MRLFISYSREDLAAVGELEGDLEAAGHAVFRDEELSGGQHWWERLLGEIRECDVFVFALSRTSLTSRPCQLEYRYAHDLGKTILPVRVERGVSAQELPPELSTLQFVEYQRNDKSAALSLVRAVAHLPPSAALPDPLPEEPEVPISYVSELRDQLADPETLPPAAQSSLLGELDRRLKADDDPVAIENLLRRLLRRSDVTPVSRRRAKRMLGAIEAAKPRLERAPPRWGGYLAAGGVAVTLLVVAVTLWQPAGGEDANGGDPLPPASTAATGELASTTPATTPTSAAPNPVTSVSAAAPADEAIENIEQEVLEDFAALGSFDADLGCHGTVRERVVYLAGAWDPSYLGTWFDGAARWMWDPEYLAWIRVDGLGYYPATGVYWSLCTGRWWDPIGGTWVG